MIRHALALLAHSRARGPGRGAVDALRRFRARDGGIRATVAVSGDQVVVAEPNNVRAPGAVYVYGKRDAAGPRSVG